MISLICLLRFLFPYWKYGTIVDKNTIKISRIIPLTFVLLKSILVIIKTLRIKRITDILSIKNKYARYKKMAVATTHLYLNNEYSDTTWLPYFHNNKSKNDDLADAYLMTRFYINKILNLK